MKKDKVIIFLAILMIVISAVGCGSQKSELTMDSIKQVFEENGFMYNKDEEPIYALIGAKDGAWFDKEDITKVVVYEYVDKKSLEKAQNENAFMSGFEVNGLFLLETSDDNIKIIFNDL